MANKDLGEIAKRMRKLDICMLTTQTGRGLMNTRPMSNNGDVEYDGNSYFFTYDGSGVVKDITNNPQVSLGFEGAKKLYISVAGKAKLIRSRATMEQHWVPSLKKWFQQGLDTPGILMIHVKGNRVRYWQGEDQGEVKI